MQKGAFCGLQNTPKCVFPLWELMMPQTRLLGRGHPSPYFTPLGASICGSRQCPSNIFLCNRAWIELNRFHSANIAHHFYTVGYTVIISSLTELGLTLHVRAAADWIGWRPAPGWYVSHSLLLNSSYQATSPSLSEFTFNGARCSHFEL